MLGMPPTNGKLKVVKGKTIPRVYIGPRVKGSFASKKKSLDFISIS